MTRRAGWVIVLSFMSGLLIHTSAVAADDGRLALTTDRVVVFKDGHALVIKRATGTADADGAVYTNQVPTTAVLGSFWATLAEGDVAGMRAEWEPRWTRADQPSARPSGTAAQLLQRVVNQQATLKLGDGSQITGKVVQTIESGPDKAFVLIDTGGDTPQTIALPSITEITADGLDGAGGQPVFAPTRRLTVLCGDDKAGQEVEVFLMYFTPNVRWIPTYRVAGELKDSAEISLQAEILNEHESFKNVALDLVVGVPNFRFKDTVSPLALETQMQQTLRQAAPHLMGQFSNASYTTRAGEFRHDPPAGVAPGMPAAPEELASADDDLFVYSIENFTLGKGGRATMPLWQQDAPLKHLYTMDKALVRDRGTGRASCATAAASGGMSPLKLAKNEVWHQLALSNKSKTPWTTGAAMILRDTLPLGQDPLTYTPMGGQTLLPITVAVNVRASLDEEETAREPNALKWSGSTYAQLTKRGTATVTNFHKETRRVRVALSMGGEITEASHDARIRHDSLRQGDWNGSAYQINKHSSVVWELDLEPGQTIELTYDVVFYVR